MWCLFRVLRGLNRGNTVSTRFQFHDWVARSLLYQMSAKAEVLTRRPSFVIGWAKRKRLLSLATRFPLLIHIINPRPAIVHSRGLNRLNLQLTIKTPKKASVRAISET